MHRFSVFLKKKGCEAIIVKIFMKYCWLLNQKNSKIIKNQGQILSITLKLLKLVLPFALDFQLNDLGVNQMIQYTLLNHLLRVGYNLFPLILFH